MHIKFWARDLLFFLIVLILLTMSGCGITTKILPQESDGGFPVKDGKMLHVKQVLERYDALGQPVPQYYELWLADKKGLCVELDKKGNEIRRILDTEGKHITYDPKTRVAVKYDFSQMFILNFNILKSSYPKTVKADDQQYAGRNCAIYLLENDKDKEWMKLYVDKEMGYVLLCDAPLFRLRTAEMEVLPMDNKLFTTPSDITYK